MLLATAIAVANNIYYNYSKYFIKRKNNIAVKLARFAIFIKFLQNSCSAF